MNQILSVEMPKSKQGNYKRNTNKADTKTIIIFFCVILILFALILFLVAHSISNKNNDEAPQSNTTPAIVETKPLINCEMQGENSINLIVSHDKQISSITYGWNDLDKVELTDIGETTKEIPLEIPTGTNILNVTVVDINGIIATNSFEYTGTQIPIPSLVLEEMTDGKIKLTAHSDVEIAYISYNWDGGEETQIQVDNVKFEKIIDAKEGEHKLKVMLVDKEGKEATGEIKTKGDNKPTLDITRDAGNTKIYIKATDDEGLSKIIIEDYVTGKKDEKEISGKEYNTAVLLKQGENKLIITVYNINQTQHKRRIGIVK